MNYFCGMLEILRFRDEINLGFFSTNFGSVCLGFPFKKKFLKQQFRTFEIDQKSSNKKNKSYSVNVYRMYFVSMEAAIVTVLHVVVVVVGGDISNTVIFTFLVHAIFV